MSKNLNDLFMLLAVLKFSLRYLVQRSQLSYLGQQAYT